MNLLFFRMVIYSLFPITAALIYDLITPGQVTRRTLQVPFNQQCYICAPFTLVTSASLVLFSHTQNTLYLGALILAQIWLFGSNYLFFRGELGRSPVACALISLFVLVISWAGLTAITVLAVSYKGIS